MRRTGNDRGAVRVTTTVVLVVVLAVIGVFGFDAVSVMSSRVSAENDAQTAAYAASQEYHNTLNLDDAYQAAVTSIAGKGDTVLTHHFVIDTDGTVHLLVRRPVHTLVLKRIGPFRKYTVALESGDANSIN
jgi:Flp pilus assembly protein TadG